MKNPAFDAYIAKAPPFAKPILAKIRALFHKACPDLEETIKWGCPSFVRGGILGIMAAFKAHVRLVYWRHSAEKIASVDDLPNDAAILKSVRQAVASVGTPAPPRKPKPPVKIPPYVLAALRKNKKALAAFKAFPPGYRREYVEWIAGAKTAETRERRMSTSLAWIAEGKPLNWKYR